MLCWEKVPFVRVLRRRVGRPADPGIKARNQEIYARWYEGESVQELADRYDRKPVVIARIISKQHPEIKTETNRALLRGRLEWLLSEMRDVIVDPGWKMQPNGRPAETPDGEAALDMGVRTEAAKVFLAILDRTAKLDATDKAPPKPEVKSHEVARQEMEAHLAGVATAIAAQRSADEDRHRRELENVRRNVTQFPVVPGQVVAELPGPDSQPAGLQFLGGKVGDAVVGEFPPVGLPGVRQRFVG